MNNEKPISSTVLFMQKLDFRNTCTGTVASTTRSSSCSCRVSGWCWNGTRRIWAWTPRRRAPPIPTPTTPKLPCRSPFSNVWTGPLASRSNVLRRPSTRISSSTALRSPIATHTLVAEGEHNYIYLASTVLAIKIIMYALRGSVFNNN